MTDNEYHSNKALGSTDLKNLLRGPAFYKQGRESSEQTSAMMIGSALHSFILEPAKFDENYYFLPSFGRTKAEQAAKEQLVNSFSNICKEPIPESQLTEAEAIKIRNAVMAHPQSWLLKNAVIEQPIFWNAEGIELKCKPDALVELDGGQGFICIDLKTTQDASEWGFNSSVSKFGYHIQAAHYINGIKSLFPDALVAFWFLCVEKKVPYGVGLYQLDSTYIDIGNEEIKRAVSIYNHCNEINSFDKVYDTDIKTLHPPKWLINKE
jgi:exodeoxyribonuclease VIII